MTIDLVHDELIVMSVRGALTDDGSREAAHRLDRLISCRPRRLRVDYSETTDSDAEGAAIISRAAHRLRAGGGEFEKRNARPDLPAAMARATAA